MNVVANVFVLDVWENIIQHLSPCDIVNLSSVCRSLRDIVLKLCTKLDFNGGYPFYGELLKYAVSERTTSVNINYCYWLTSRQVLQLVSLTNLQHLYLVDCEMNLKCVEAIAKLHLISLSFTYDRNWKYYLEKHLNDAIPCFERLRNLEIHCTKPILTECTYIYEIYTKIIPHCKELYDLQLTGNPKYVDRGRVATRSQFLSSTTPLPHLKSLVIDIYEQELEYDISRFLNAILKDKIVPLEHVDVGLQTCNLYRIGTLLDPQIPMDKSTFVFRDDGYMLRQDHPDVPFDYNVYLDLEGLQKFILQGNYQKIILENIESHGFYIFVQQVIFNSSQTLHELYLKPIQWIYAKVFLPPIAISCSQIAILDLKFVNFHMYEEPFEKWQALFDAFSNLSNLRKLCLKKCQFSSPGDAEAPSPLWSMTNKCHQLEELRITNHRTVSVHCDTLSAIAQCEQLKVLHLPNFKLGRRSVDRGLLKLTVWCTQLEDLKLHFASTFSGHALSCAQNLKYLSISTDVQNNKKIFPKMFFDNLVQCKRLEKIKLGRGVYINSENCEYLENTLMELKKVYVVIVEESKYDNSTDDHMVSVFKKMCVERPGFYGTTTLYNPYRQMPQAHRHL